MVYVLRRRGFFYTLGRRIRVSHKRHSAKSRALLTYFIATLAFVDLYAVLCIPRDAPPLDIKQAYHRILLATHPDKRKCEDTASIPLDVGLLQEAYLTLSNQASREAYDASLAANEARFASNPRPAQVVSLEEFTSIINDVDVEQWTYPCRCGSAYQINHQQLEDDQHLIGCDSCSEVIWVGYEAECEDASVGRN